MVPVEVDQHGVGLSFAPQAYVTALNRKKRRQAYKDHLEGDVTEVDWSQYSPEEMAQIKADAKMNPKEFGNDILDRMEEKTGIVNKLDREHVNQGEGGIGWSNPRAAYDKELGEKAYKKRIEKYRNASPEGKARMRLFDPDNPDYTEIERQQGVTVPNPEKDRKEELGKRFRASMAAGE
jgi:hypothetical protein